MQTLIDKIIEYRAKNGLSQEDFAKLIGITQRALCMIEQGKTTPRKTTIAKIKNLIETKKEEGQPPSFF